MAFSNGEWRIEKNMPQPYPDPNITGFTGFFEYVNTVTSNLAMPLLCLVLSVVVFIIMMRSDNYETASCFLTAILIGFISSAFLWAASLLQGKIVVIFLLLTIAAGITNELNRK